MSCGGGLFLLQGAACSPASFKESPMSENGRAVKMPKRCLRPGGGTVPAKALVKRAPKRRQGHGVRKEEEKQGLVKTASYRG